MRPKSPTRLTGRRVGRLFVPALAIILLTGWLALPRSFRTLLEPAALAAPGAGEFQANTRIPSDQTQPAVATDASGNFVVVWTSFAQDTPSTNGIYAQRYDAAGNRRGVEFRVNTTTADNQDEPAVAMDSDGDFVVAWRSFGQDGSGTGVYAQRYDAAGAPQGGEFRANTHTNNSQGEPSVAMDAAGNFLIVWSSVTQDPDGSPGVYGQRYDSAGVAQGGESRLNPSFGDVQDQPVVAMDSDGDFVVAWRGIDADSSMGIYAQRYDSAGVAQGGELHVNTTTVDAQDQPSAAMDSDGDFVIAWRSLGQDPGGSAGVYAQRYNSAGAAQGGEFRVNTFTTSTQQRPSAAMDASGDFAVVWESEQDPGLSTPGIYGQRYDSAGVAQDGEFRLNSFTSNFQTRPSAALDAGGDLVAAWGSFEQDSDGSAGVYGKLLRLPGTNLSVTKTVTRDPALLNRVLGYNVTVTNAGPEAATGVSLTDTLPAGITFLSAEALTQGTCAESALTVTCDLGDIADGQSVEVFIRVKPRSLGTITNTATVSSNETDPDPDDNTFTLDTEVVTHADLSVTNTDSADPSVVGDQITYTLTVTNQGPYDATGVVLTDALSAGSAFVSASPGCIEGVPGLVTCAVGDLANGASAVRTVTVSTGEGGIHANVASADGDEEDGDDSDNVDTQNTRVVAPLKLLLSAPTVAGGCANLTGTVHLTSAAPAGGVTVSLSSTNAGAETPPSVFIPGGATKSDPFVVTTSEVASTQTGLIRGTLGPKTVGRSLKVTPGSCGPTAE